MYVTRKNIGTEYLSIRHEYELENFSVIMQGNAKKKKKRRKNSKEAKKLLQVGT